MFWAKMLDFLVNVSLTSLGIIFHLVAIMFAGVVCDTILDTFTVSKRVDIGKCNFCELYRKS